MEVPGRRVDEQEQKYCQPCLNDEESVVATGYCKSCNEFFCTDCIKYHRKQSATKNHLILEGQLMPRSTAPNLDDDTCNKICNKHKGEVLKFFCSSHDELGCGDCMVLDHKICKVDRIQDISGRYFDSPEHRNLIGKLVYICKQLDGICTSLQTADRDIDQSYSQALRDIKSFRKEIDAYLDKVEADMLDILNKRKLENEQIVTRLKAEHLSLTHEIKDMKDSLDKHAGEANGLFVVANQIKGRAESMETACLQMLYSSQTEKYVFNKSLELHAAMSSSVPFGTLKNINNDVRPRKLLKDMEPIFQSEIEIKSHQDQSDCFIIASVLFSQNQIVLADFGNKCLKVFDIEKGELQGRIQLSGEPHDVAVLGKQAIAVTIPDEKKIKVFALTDKNDFVEIYAIDRWGYVRKIACRNKRLVIAYESTLEVMNTNWVVIKQGHPAELGMIVSIEMEHDNNAFYVANSFKENKATAVYKFDFDCKVLAKYTDNGLPDVRGLASTQCGIVLVCKWDHKGSIYMLSHDGKKIKEILLNHEHAQMPYCISFCDARKKLFLCNYKTSIDPKEKNVLKQFQMW